MVVFRLPGGKVAGDIRSMLFIFLSLVGLIRHLRRRKLDQIKF